MIDRRSLFAQGLPAVATRYPLGILSYAAVALLALIGVAVGLRAKGEMTREDFDWLMLVLRRAGRQAGANS